MTIDRYIAKIQSVFGASKSEVVFVALILSAIIVGQFVTLDDRNSLAELTQELDSYQQVSHSSFIGLDNEGKTNEVLAQGDTLLKKDSKFPGKKKEEKLVGKININTASKVELMKLNGIGEKTAEKIIDYRRTTSFKSIEDIQNVKGIGPKKFEKMKDNITV